LLSIDLVANAAPRRTRELVGQSAAAIAWKVELASGRFSPSLKTALQALFDQRA
jgi:hypothetical protein